MIADGLKTYKNKIDGREKLYYLCSLFLIYKKKILFLKGQQLITNFCPKHSPSICSCIVKLFWI